jgi:UDP-N-acetylmuramate--alanine ligase
MSKKAFVNGDDELSIRAATATSADIITFGFDKKNNYYAENITKGKFGFCFDVMKKGEKIGHLDMHIPGRHNILNGLAAFSVCDDMGVEAEGIAKAVETFTGAGRRFEFLGKMQGFTLADDYAHHPTEIKATLSAAKELDYNNVIAVFQPFTFSRTALLKDEFIEALSLADKVILIGENRTKPIKNGLKDMKFEEENIYILNDVRDAYILLDKFKDERDLYALFENDLPDTYTEIGG